MKNLVPKRRFEEFKDSDPWEQRKIKDIFKVTRGHVLAVTKTAREKTASTPYPVYSSQTTDQGLMGYYNDYLYSGAITWTTDGANAGTVNYREGKFYCTNVCGVLISEEGYANKMISEALNKVAWKHVSKVGNPKLMNNVMSEIVISIPRNMKEQSVISNFFGSLDNLITLHQRKLDKLKETKSAYLSEMFPKEGEFYPKRRFAGFTGPWEQRKLGDVAQYFNGGSFENDVQEKGKYELVTLKSVDMNGNLVSSGRYVNIETPTLVKGTLVMILSEQSPGLLGMTAQIPMNNKYVLNQRVAEIRPNQGIDSYFLSMIINKNQQYFSKHGAGTKVQNISKPNVENYKFSCPAFHEQQKIGTFFQQLDNLITLHQRKLDKLQALKQAYLSEMFV